MSFCQKIVDFEFRFMFFYFFLLSVIDCFIVKFFGLGIGYNVEFFEGMGGQVFEEIEV